MSQSQGRTALPRVVHVTTAHRADDVRIFERECRSLAGSGRYDVYLAAAGDIPAGSGVTFLPLLPRPSSRAGRFSAGPRRALALTTALAVDVWHFHDPELLPVALKLAWSGRRVIWDAHEDYLAQFSEAGGKSWVPRPARRLVRSGTAGLLSAMDRLAAGIVAATPTIASRYENPRTVVVGNEARVEDFRDARPDLAARRVLFTGNVGRAHLFDELVAAISDLPGVRLAVAGREPPASTWDAAAARLGDRLEHLGWLDRPGLSRAMSASSLGVALYAPLATYLDSDASPTKVFEFAAAGLPIVGSPIAPVARLLESSNAGFVADDFTPASLRDSIIYALGHPTEWELASVNGRAWAQSHGGWSESEAELLRLYSALLG